MKFLTFPSLQPKQFGGIAYVWMARKLWWVSWDNMRDSVERKSKKLPILVIRRPVRFVCIQNTSSSDVLRGLGTQAGMLGSPKGSPKFLFGRPTVRSGRPKGSLKFSLEHSLALGVWYIKHMKTPKQYYHCINLFLRELANNASLCHNKILNFPVSICISLQ